MMACIHCILVHYCKQVLSFKNTQTLFIKTSYISPCLRYHNTFGIYSYAVACCCFFGGYKGTSGTSYT